MARDRLIPVDFWTREAVIDCQPMTRLLLIGLWNFADDFGVQPLKPRTIRLQVFPGDAIDNDALGAMIEELRARGLVDVYEVDGAAYVAVVDWAQSQRVGRRARRRYPPAGGWEATVPGPGETGEAHAAATPAAVVDEPPAAAAATLGLPSSPQPSASLGPRGEKEGSPAESTASAAAMAYPRTPDGRVHAADL
ncbi:MAG: hypothetical protein KF889_02375 [Alphaproteobacteria bacterium]|nr:hypothetical protein [Alphaproteobacteria bacterium]MCW5741755.1 hypothetical protein [Alphaproteobacteria bacterium]